MRSATVDAASAQLPHLPTFALRPSWLNRAGRIDRSACVELLASDIWRRVDERGWIIASRATRSLATPTQPFLIAWASFILTAPLLAQLHDSRPPHALAGDFRTAKANAMKHPTGPPKRAAGGNSMLAPNRAAARLPLITPNPNRGASRSKVLALWGGTELDAIISPASAAGWSQTVTLQRWRLHDRLAQHFLVCPRCPPRCRKRHFKLFMPLATVAECDDAEIAEGWVRRFDALAICSAARVRITPESMQLRAALIDRYGLLFRGGGAGNRQLVCRACLGVRYGEVKWRRQRESKAVARRATRLQIAQTRERAEQDARNAADDAAHLQLLGESFDRHALAATVRELRAERIKRERRARENQRRNARRAAAREAKCADTAARAALDDAALEKLDWLEAQLAGMREARRRFGGPRPSPVPRSAE